MADQAISSANGGGPRCLRRRLIWLLPLLAGGCTAVPRDVAAPRPAPHFAVEAFFAGHSEGSGTLKLIFSRARSVTVHGNGRLASDGTLILDQNVIDAAKAPKQREWRIRRVAADRYAGTLSDASGPVSGDVTGNRLHLRFTMKGGLATDQWLSLRADGRIADNIMVVRKFGVTVATLHETIRKVD